MKKRLLAVLLATAMATCMVAGCGNQERHYIDDDEDDEDEDDEDEDDDDDDDKDEDDDDDVVAVGEYDDHFEVSPDSILYGADLDIRMFYGVYLLDGETEDADKYYDDIREVVHDTINAVDVYGYDTELLAMPTSIEIGKFEQFWGNTYYQVSDGTYSCYNGNGRYGNGSLDQEDYRLEKEALLNEYGEDGIEYYNNMVESYQLDYALICFPYPDYNGTDKISALVELEDNKLHFYNYTYNDDKTVTKLDEIYNCRADYKGAMLEISKNDVVFEYVPYEFRKDAYVFFYNGPYFVEDKTKALNGLCGLTIGSDYDDEYKLRLSHGYFVTGEESFGDGENQPFEYDIKTGEFTLTFGANYGNTGTYYNYYKDSDIQYRTVNGQFIWCGYEYGYVFKVDNTFYYYQTSKDAFYSGVFGYNGIADGGSNDSAGLGNSLNIHEQVSNDLSNAFGDDAVVDDQSGAVTLENSILFGVDSAEISDEGKEYLDDFIVTYVTTIKPYLDDGSVTSIVIEGHTDPDGSYEYNLDLSERRAQAVADYVIAQQPELADVTITVGYSYLYPIYDDNGVVDKAASRRVVFSFISK